MSLRGNTAALGKLAAKIRALPVELSKRVAVKTASDFTTRAQASFAAGQTPYGDAWAAGKGGHAVTLRRSGALVASLKFVAYGPNVRAALGVSYAKYQIGKRLVLPNGSLPVAWSAAVREISISEIKAALS